MFIVHIYNLVFVLLLSLHYLNVISLSSSVRFILCFFFVFFEDGSILKIHFNENGFSWSEHYDSQISTAFYYGRYSIRL